MKTVLSKYHFPAWIPILALVEVEGNQYLKVIDYRGGIGKKPPINVFIGENGYVNDISDAVPIGNGGRGTGVQSVTGDGVGGTPENPVLSYPTPGDIGAIAAGDLSAYYTKAETDAAIENSDKVSSKQEGGIGTLITNIIQVTQAQYDNLTPQAGTFYAIVG